LKIFLSGIEAGGEFPLVEKEFKEFKWMLCSYYYLKQDVFEKVLKKSELMMIDSGAHSFQKGKKVDWQNYTRRYADWISKNDSNKILGYFEMDVDNILGYEKVLELRSILENASDKIIPVWHKNRGIEDFKSMCKRYQGKIIAITGFKNEDIRDDQYILFLKHAWDNNCKVHCLGMTRQKILTKVPFDFVDSSSWKQKAIHGNIGNKKVTKEYSRNYRYNVMIENLKLAINMQNEYYMKWRKVNND